MNLSQYTDYNAKKELSPDILTLLNAKVFPWRSKKRNRASATVFDQDGTLCYKALCWKDTKTKRSGIPANPQKKPITTLKGRHLYCGILFDHFGHFLCESLSRLWAIDSVNGLSGLIFCIANKQISQSKARKLAENTLASIGVTTPVVILNQVTRIEELIVAPQGFGLKDMSAGSPEFKAFLNNYFRAKSDIKAPEKRIYISRRKHMQNGRFLLEDWLETLLVENGFEIFHPQLHSIDQQIAKYQSASHILASDCSAMFLAGFAVPKNSQIGIIQRRLLGATTSLKNMFRFQAECDVYSFHCINRLWMRADQPNKPIHDVSLLDFPKLGEELLQAGFIERANWRMPPQDAVLRSLSGWANQFSVNYIPKDITKSSK